MRSQVSEASNGLAYLHIPAFTIPRLISRLTPARFLANHSNSIRLLVILFIALLTIVKFSASTPSDTTPAPAPVHNSWIANLIPLKQKLAPKKNTTTCVEQIPTIYQAPFSNCTSLNLNYSYAGNSPVSNKDFNIYSGAPEANNEAQYYSDSLENINVRDGSLNLTALNNPTNGFRYTSSRITTLGKHDFQYGKLSIRAIIPNGSGTWPAIWMLSTDHKYKFATANSDPNRDLNDGEIDIAESVGIEPNVVYGVAHSLARPPTGTGDYFSKTTVTDNETSYQDYGLEWTPTELTYTIDGNAFFTIKKQPDATFASWPYDQKYYLIINLALGGSWGGRDRTHYPVDGVDPEALPATMRVKSISYYRYIVPANQ